jgi:class 3 adenylate cyclase
MLDAGEDPCEHHDTLWDRFGQRKAVMVCDTAGFSRTCRSHGVLHFLTRLMRLRQLCQPVFDRHGCDALRFEADNIFAVFDGVDQALATAMAVHSAIHTEPLMLHELEPMRVAIGIGYGDVLYSATHEGHFGEEMNFASKLGEDIGIGDETLLTESAFRAASEELLSGFEPDIARVSEVEIAFHRHRFCPP